MTRWLSDAALAHLRGLEDAPDFSATRYRLLGSLGAGGMGSIYLAEDRDLDRPVAIKVLHGGPADSQLAARLLQEARILAQLEHPGIVPVHAIGTLPDGRVYYVMKRIRGTRLDAAVAGLTLDQKLRVFQRICEAVAFAHAAGVVHRDLKPENVMVGEFGEVLVLDWGVAKRLTEAPPPPVAPRVGSDTDRTPAGPTGAAAPGDPADTGPAALRTQDGTLLGTPAYMAPEQRRGEVHRIDARADIWALGAVLYFSLTGRSPVFESPAACASGPATPPEAFAVVPPRQLVPGVPRPLDALCMRAMAPAIESRYAAVEELQADVARFQAGQRVQADPETPLQRVARVAGRYRVPLLIVAAYLVVRILIVALGR